MLTSPLLPFQFADRADAQSAFEIARASVSS